MSFDKVHEIPEIMRHPGIALHELPRRIDNSASNVVFPVTLADSASSNTGLGSHGTGLRLLRKNSLCLVVIDDRHGVPACALNHAIHTGRQIGAIFGLVSSL